MPYQIEARLQSDEFGSAVNQEGEYMPCKYGCMGFRNKIKGIYYKSTLLVLMVSFEVKARGFGCAYFLADTLELLEAINGASSWYIFSLFCRTLRLLLTHLNP